MREYRRSPVERSRLSLRRGADGRLRPAVDDDDIGDVWAEQRRIRLKEAIEEDKRKAEKAKQGKWAFLRKKGKKASKPPEAVRPTKEVVVSINMPKLKLPKLRGRRLAQFYASLSKKQRLTVGVMGLLVVASLGGFFMYGDQPKDQAEKKKVAATTTSINGGEKPAYDTLLPEGKTIEELGGWARVSPADKEPVFAFADTVNGVPIIVSQQPLPASFKKDAAAEIEKVASQFGAKEKITTDNLTAFLGTSIKGPQSLITSKNGLLILIKSDTKIENPAWADYIDALY